MQIRSDPLPKSPAADIDFSAIPIGKSLFLAHSDPHAFIRHIRYSARIFHRNNPTSHLSIHLVSAPGRVVSHDTQPIGIQIWHTQRKGPQS